MKGAKARPFGIERSLVKSWRGRREIDEIEIAVAGDIHEFLASAAQRRKRRSGRDDLHRAEPAIAEIGFVEPRLVMLAQHAGNAFAVEIKPAVVFAVNAAGQVGKAFLAHFL